MKIRSIELKLTPNPEATPGRGPEGPYQQAARLISVAHTYWPWRVANHTSAHTDQPINPALESALWIITIIRATKISTKGYGDHRRVLPVLRYPRNIFIYQYPLIGVIFMVILLIFIIQNYPNLFSKYYPKFTIWVIYPFIFNLGEF